MPVSGTGYRPQIPSFAPAKTIKEAEKWAKQNIADDVGYEYAKKSISLEDANTINKSFYDIYKNTNIDKLKSFEIGMKDNAFADIQNKYVNIGRNWHSRFRTPDILKKQIKQLELDMINATDEAKELVFKPTISRLTEELKALKNNAFSSKIVADHSIYHFPKYAQKLDAVKF